MEIKVEKSAVPIYKQVKQQIITNILKGNVKEDEQLPSIRQLAHDLKISSMTTQKAYNELSDEGFIVSVSGKGHFVASRNNDLLHERLIYEMEVGIEKVIEIGKSAGLNDIEIVDIITDNISAKFQE